jgi:hypothetical protein
VVIDAELIGGPQFDPRNCDQEGVGTTWCQNW